MIDKSTIEKIVIEILKNKGITSRDVKPTLLVICSNEPETKILESLQYHWEPILVNPDKDELPYAGEQAIFLNVDQDLLVKSALGMTDTNKALMFSKLMMQGTTLHFDLDAVLRGLIDEKGVGWVNPEYKKQMKQYYEKIKKYGVSFSKVEDIRPKNTPYSSYNQGDMRLYNEKLLTQGVIDSWSEDEILVSNHTIITPLARDTARERKITIKRNES